jgi:predicted ABC-type ATPase
MEANLEQLDELSEFSEYTTQLQFYINNSAQFINEAAVDLINRIRHLIAIYQTAHDLGFTIDMNYINDLVESIYVIESLFEK